MIRRQLAISEDHLDDGPAPDFAQAYGSVKLSTSSGPVIDGFCLPDQLLLRSRPKSSSNRSGARLRSHPYTSGPPSTLRSFDIEPRMHLADSINWRIQGAIGSASALVRPQSREAVRKRRANPKSARSLRQSVASPMLLGIFQVQSRTSVCLAPDQLARMVCIILTHDQFELAGNIQRTFNVKTSPLRGHVADDTADRPAIAKADGRGLRITCRWVAAQWVLQAQLSTHC
jgi:hypothetical protein